MNRLNELADWIDSIDAIPTNDENLREIATLLRAASAETVGTEWPNGMAHSDPHNADLQAARLAVADARGALRDEVSLNKGIAAERDEANAERAALQRELDAALEQKHGHACAMATLAEERDEALATAERHRNDTWQHAEACRTLDAERKSALHRIEQMQEVIDNAAMLWQLSSEGSRTADAMYQALRPMLEPGSLAAGNHSEMPKGSPVPAADLAKIADLQRAIDEAMRIYDKWAERGGFGPPINDIFGILRAASRKPQASCSGCGTTQGIDQELAAMAEACWCPSCSPHATRREGQQAATVAENATPAIQRPEEFGPEVIQAYKPYSPRQWRREYYGDRKFWMSWLWSGGERVTMLQDHPIASYEGFVNLHDDTWCLAYVDGDTLDTLPPLPNPDKSPDTVSGSPVKGPDLCKVGVFGPGYAPHPLSTGSTPAVSTQPTGVTPAVSPCCRELIARLAEAVGNYFEDGTVMVADLIVRLRDIESAARKGGAE